MSGKLFKPMENDPFNRAADLFQDLRRYESGTADYVDTLMDVIRLCQVAIQEHKHNGDAHCLLANAYLIAALDSHFSSNYPYFLTRAAASIQAPKRVGMYIKNRAIADKVYDGITLELSTHSSDWVEGVRRLPKDLDQLYSEYYESAISSRSLSETRTRLTGEGELEDSTGGVPVEARGQSKVQEHTPILGNDEYLAICNRWADLELPSELQEKMNIQMQVIGDHLMPWASEYIRIKSGMWELSQQRQMGLMLGATVAQMLRGCVLLGLEFGLTGKGITVAANGEFSLPKEVNELLPVAKNSCVGLVLLISETNVEASKHSEEESRAFLSKFRDLMNAACLEAYIHGLTLSAEFGK